MKLTLSVELPEVVEKFSRMTVRCGETYVYVYEHGSIGSGAWAVWDGIGGSIIKGGMNLYSLEQAMQDAREYVQERESLRLFHLAVDQAHALKEVTK